MSGKSEFCSNCENNNNFDNLSYQDAKNVANYLTKKVALKPKFGIICGSGLGLLGDILEDTTTFDYHHIQKDIPYFPVSTTEGHSGNLLFGTINNIPIICFQGRFHFYEGHSLSKCVFPVRLMKALGVTTLILSNAAGSINLSYKTGDIMFIKDHINFMGFAGQNPLRGPNCEELGQRFLSLNDAYNSTILASARKITDVLGLQGVHEGVYGCIGGPCYETVAEIRVLKMLGVDAVGMSTVHEVIAARHCGINVFAFSLITNECVAEYKSGDKPDHGEILSVAKEKEDVLKKFVVELITQLNKLGF